MRNLRLFFAALAVTILAISGFPTIASAQNGARIHLIHGIPNTPVDVAAGGANVFENFDFGDTQDLSALAGATLEDLQVKLAGTDVVAIDAGDVTLPSAGNVTIIAHLAEDATPTISVFENDVSTIAAGNGRLVVRHTAAAPAVDVKANGAVAFAGVVNGQEGNADLSVGTVAAEVVPAGVAGPVVIGPADLPIADGEALIVYAVGSLDADTLTVLTETITDLGSTPNRVNTGNSPISNGSSSALLLGLLAGALVLTGGGVARFARTANVNADDRA